MKDEFRFKENKMKTKKVNRIKIISLNQEKPKTCGNCHYTGNELGIVTLHCTCKEKEAIRVYWDEYGKVRSWETCKNWEIR